MPAIFQTKPKADTLCGRTLRAQRRKLGLSQPEMARLLGIGQPVLWRYEHGYSGMRLTTARRLAQILDIKVSRLYRIA